MMDNAIRSFPSQFKFKPKVENKDKLKKYTRFVILGMGGSNLASDLLKMRNPKLEIISHRDYGLPILPDVRKTLFIASSYSGNTEETLDGFKEAERKEFPLAVLTTGGKLLELAKKGNIPYVVIPKTGIQPRSALGFALIGLATLMGLSALVKELQGLSTRLNARALEAKGKGLAKKIKGRIPVIYSSFTNAAVAYNWKIKFNETGKIPAFANSFPELNHNEMTGYDSVPANRTLAKKVCFIFLKEGSTKILKRMEVTARLYKKRGLSVEMISVQGKGVFERVCNSLLLADWTAYYTGKGYGAETEQVPMVEEFKKLIR